MTTQHLLEQFFFAENQPESLVVANPCLGGGVAELVRKAVAESEYRRDHVLFPTSGTTSAPKWVGHSRRGLKVSARAVNAHLGATSEDRWSLTIPAFHVGGAGILVRAWLAGSAIRLADRDWSPDGFVEHCRQDEISLCSLVPAQVHDLVAGRFQAPRTLRAVLVGGGALTVSIAAEAKQLGWPLLRTYGLTEAASSVAIQPLGEAGDFRDPEVLPHWESRLDEHGELSIRGQALFRFYLRLGKKPAKSTIELQDPGSWFATGDRFERGGEVDRRLRFQGRLDAVIKILGERVLLDELRQRFAAVAGPQPVLAALPHDRLGAELVAVFPGAGDASAVNRFNQSVAPFEKIQRVCAEVEIPRTLLGKIDEGALERRLSGTV